MTRLIDTLEEIRERLARGNWGKRYRDINGVNRQRVDVRAAALFAAQSK